MRSLVDNLVSVTIDEKVVEDDRFDDIEIVSATFRSRTQLKSSEDLSKELSLSHFSSSRSSLRFDRLVKTMLEAGSSAADEYRLSVTWLPPSKTGFPDGLLQCSDDPGTFSEYPTKTFRLDHRVLWPKDSEPVLKPLVSSEDSDSPVSRDELIRFCERFVVETSLPPASLDLDSPGPLEELLINLMSTSVGIGRYPNHHREIRDACAQAIFIASVARVKGQTLQPKDVIERLRVNTDFGRVAQEFPIDYAVLQQRRSPRQLMSSAVKKGGVHLAVGGPGAGKSWLLTQVSEDLRTDGVVVARHYCYLEPGDDLVLERVTSNVFFGNLIGELDDAFHRAGIQTPSRFSADLDALDEYLELAAKAEQLVVIVVDGLDHIFRVRDASDDLTSYETNIIERLATLNLPPNVALVLGSQPGEHLDPIYAKFANHLSEHAIAPWSEGEIVELAECHNVLSALDAAQIECSEQRTEVLNRLAERSEGNPLYGRYLSIGLASGLRSGQVVDPIDWLDGNPNIQGDIASYYRHVYDSISAEGQLIAGVLGALDFSINEEELREITGPVASDWVPQALRVMQPILSNTTGQSGLRIFHESFRRFVLEELSASGKRLSNVLIPVANWLQSGDFFADSKCYRFTLQVLSRAEQEQGILDRVSSDFVQRSLQYGHPFEAINRNLDLALSAAARALDWPSLVRYTELKRALDACFSPHANNWREYWITYEALFGPTSLKSRLLFDGRPTLPREEGLSLCSKIEEIGVTAPWREYLDLRVTESEEDFTYGKFAPYGELLEQETDWLAAAKGRLKLSQRFKVVKAAIRTLEQTETHVTSYFCREVAVLLASEFSAPTVERFLDRIEQRDRGENRIALEKSRICGLRLGLSDAYRSIGDVANATKTAVIALDYAQSPEEAIWSLECGAPRDQARQHACDLDSINLSLNGNGTIDAEAVSKWVASIRLIANDSAADDIIIKERTRLAGIGWYRCWLRFALESAVAEYAFASGHPIIIEAVFDKLTEDTRPFAGSPRACDLYSIHAQIDQSIRRALNLVVTAEEWQHCTDALAKARTDTSTQFDREDGGPISTSSFFSMLLEQVSRPSAAAAVVPCLERELMSEEEGGTYYSNHAEYRMRLARLQASICNRDKAIDHWREAAQLLLGYGFHKDISLFDIVESAPTLAAVSQRTALTALGRLQPLVTAALRHTDGRETKRLPNAWFQALLNTSPVHAIELLSRENARELGQAWWVADTALEDALDELKDEADPALLDSLWSTLPTDIEYEGEGAKIAEQRLHPLKRMVAENGDYLSNRFTRLYAEVHDDARRHRDEALSQLDDFAVKYRLNTPWATPVNDSKDQSYAPSRKTTLSREPFIAVTPRLFSPTPTYAEVLAILRRLSGQHALRGKLAELAILPLSYLITEMVDRGEESSAEKIIRFIARESSAWAMGDIHPIGLLASCLDNAGHDRLAAISFAYTFTTSNGDRWWSNFGGRKQYPAIKRAIEIDRALTLQIVADEINRFASSGYITGVTRHVVELLSNFVDQEIALNCWEEAFKVFESRLKYPGNGYFFEPLDPCEEFDWTIDEALSALLLSRIGNASNSRKIAALSGFQRILNKNHEALIKPLRWLLTQNATISTVQLVLLVLLETGEAASQTVNSVKDLLQNYARSESWSLSWLAKKLLAGETKALQNELGSRNASEPAPSVDNNSVADMADDGRVLNKLKAIWPSLSPIVEHRLTSIAKGALNFEQITRERQELKYGNSEHNVPGAVLSWPAELFISVLDNTLVGLREQLWKTGTWRAETENQVARLILPKPKIHLAIENSRVPRPNWDHAHKVTEGLKEIVHVPEGDSAYRNWVRLGIHEQSLWRETGNSYGRPNRSTIRTAAIVCTNLDGTVPTQASPVFDDELIEWWKDTSILGPYENAPAPQIVGLAGVTDWLSTSLALMPPQLLGTKGSLRPSQTGAPIGWLDAEGHYAVILRSWRVRDAASTTEGYSNLGCDVLVRPDVFELLADLYRTYPIRELQRVATRML
ncbi:MAG: ATP-binding protein [Pseudomonadota bacterium]